MAEPVNLIGKESRIIEVKRYRNSRLKRYFQLNQEKKLDIGGR